MHQIFDQLSFGIVFHFFTILIILLSLTWQHFISFKVALYWKRPLLLWNLVQPISYKNNCAAVNCIIIHFKSWQSWFHFVTKNRKTKCFTIRISILNYKNQFGFKSTVSHFWLKLVRAKCLRRPWALQRNEVSTIFGIIFLLSFFLSGSHTFLPEGVVLGLWNFALSFKSQKK